LKKTAMSITNHANQRLRMLAIVSIGLFVFSGCKRAAPEAVNRKGIAGLSQPVRVSSVDVNAAEPAIAAAPDGSLYVAWVNHGAKSQGDVMIAHFTGDGQMQGAPVRVNSQSGTATAWRGDPPTVAIAPDQSVLVGWTARVESESGQATDIYLSSSRDQGQTFDAPVKVNDDPKPAVHGMHSLTVAKDGAVYMAWLDERNVSPIKDMNMDAKAAGHHMESNREVFIAASTDGGRSFSRNQRVATDACPCCKTALATTSDGRVYLSWRQVLAGDFRHIAVASSADHIKTFTKPVIVSDDQWVLSGCPVSGAALFAGNDGSVHVLWYSEGKNGETGLYSSITQDHGMTFGSRQLIATGVVRGTPVLVDRRGGPAAIWQAVENNIGTVQIVPRIGNATPSNSFIVVTNAELPAAAANNARVFVAYIAKAEQYQNVWLVSVVEPQLAANLVDPTLGQVP
jgi:hypothetical protein